MTAWIVIVQVFFTVNDFPLLYKIMQNSETPPGKQILLQEFEFFLHQTSILLANVNMALTPLSINVIYTRPLGKMISLQEE